MRDLKDMQFINHIFSKHRIPAALIVASVFMLVVHFVSSTLAAPTPYAPATTLNPAEGPGDAFVEIPTGIDGSGTTGNIPKWSDSNTLTDSLLYDDTTGVGVGGAVQGYGMFEVTGDSAFTGNIFTSSTGTLGTDAYYWNGAFIVDSIQYSDSLIAGDLSFKRSPASTSMILKYDGKVGIGTTSPDQLLELEGNSAIAQLTATNAMLPGVAKFRIKTTDNSSVDHIWDIANDQPTGDLIFNEFTGTGASVQFNGLVKTPSGLVIQVCSDGLSDPGSPCDGVYQDGQIWIDTTP